MTMKFCPVLRKLCNRVITVSKDKAICGMLKQDLKTAVRLEDMLACPEVSK